MEVGPALFEIWERDREVNFGESEVHAYVDGEPPLRRVL